MLVTNTMATSRKIEVYDNVHMSLNDTACDIFPMIFCAKYT